MRGVDHAPALIDVVVREQPFDRAHAERRLAILDLLHLLGGVDVDWNVARHFLYQLGKRLRIHRAQRMRCHPQLYILRNRPLELAERRDETANIRIEAPLARLQRLRAEAGPAVERGHQRDGDARGARRIEMRQQHLAGVMHIVEFRDRGVTVLQHLDVELQRDRFRLRRGQALDEAVHELAPGPEVVLRRDAHLGEPGHRALEGVRV